MTYSIGSKCLSIPNPLKPSQIHETLKLYLLDEHILLARVIDPTKHNKEHPSLREINQTNKCPTVYFKVCSSQQTCQYMLWFFPNAHNISELCGLISTNLNINVNVLNMQNLIDIDFCSSLTINKQML
eukprot:954699_1